MLTGLVDLNPTRLRDPQQDDTTFFVTLHDTPGIAINDVSSVVIEHQLRIRFPVHFPALPMEAWLREPVFHPNIHPETGFLCLWQHHASTNTIEHALHKTAAMLGWQLLTTDPQHIMQPDAAALAQDGNRLATARARLIAPPLLGITHQSGYVYADPDVSRRRRLS